MKVRALVYAVVALYVFLNIFNIIPLSQPVSYPLGFLYPPNETGPIIYDGITHSLIAQITISATETIAENVPVTITNPIGSISSSLAQNVSSIAICFRGAYLIPNLPNGHVLIVGTPCAGTILLETSFQAPGLAVYLPGPGLVGENATIEWHVQGDYFATLVLYLRNGGIVTQDYEQNRVHVEPASVIQEETNSRNVQTLEIAAFVFALTWLIPLAEHRLSEGKVGKSVGGLDSNTKHETRVTAQKRGKNVRKKKSEKRTRKKHQYKNGKYH